MCAHFVITAMWEYRIGVSTQKDRIVVTAAILKSESHFSALNASTREVGCVSNVPAAHIHSQRLCLIGKYIAICAVSSASSVKTHSIVSVFADEEPCECGL